MSMICKEHKFINIGSISKPVVGTETIHRQEFGVKIGCALCGEIRNLWPDGTVEVVIRGNPPIIKYNDDNAE